jgi:hypothetical protein
VLDPVSVSAGESGLDFPNSEAALGSSSEPDCRLFWIALGNQGLQVEQTVLRAPGQGRRGCSNTTTKPGVVGLAPTGARGCRHGEVLTPRFRSLIAKEKSVGRQVDATIVTRRLGLVDRDGRAEERPVNVTGRVPKR